MSVLVVGVVITILLGALSFLVQSYLYTETSPGIFWQAPAAGGVLALFLAVWCLLNYSSPGANPANLPYNTILNFRSTNKMFEDPVRKLWSVKKNGKEVEYVGKKEPQATGQILVRYLEKIPPYSPWSPNDVEAVILEYKGEKVRFEPRTSEQTGYPEFVSKDGWVMPVYDRMILGNPTRANGGLFYANLMLNGLHFVAWFLCLWLILRFQWGHALLMALGFWAAMTILVLPVLLSSTVPAR